LTGYNRSLFDDEAPKSGILTPHGDRSKPDDEAIANGSRVESLYKTVAHQSTMLGYAPHCVVETLSGRCWRRFANTATFRQYEYSKLDDFVKAEPPGGLGRPGGAGELRALIYPYAFDPKVQVEPKVRSEAIEAIRLIDEATEPEATHGTNQHKRGVDNIKSSTPVQGGDSETYLLRRLKRDRPELAERVVNRQLSAHAAAVEAGFRQRLVQVAPTVEGFARAVKKHLTAAEQSDLKDQL
jgi:hypothetical protein